MQCDYFDAGRCHSCTLMGVPYDAQLAGKQARAAEVLAAHIPDDRWFAAQPSAESGFRNKAKLVVGGTPDAPTLGILDPAGQGVDLRACGLHEQPLADAIPVLAEAVTHIGLRPYDVSARTGELKHVIATVSPDGELMARFVLRSEGQLGKLRRGLPWLLERLPGLRVVSANLQPEHKAVLEGDEELTLTAEQTLPMRLGVEGRELTLHLRPRSFFQTNTAVATALYTQAARWVGGIDPSSLLDLYCGVGGFALACARAGEPSRPRAVTGIETSTEAIESARRSAGEAGVEADFRAGDAAAYALGATAQPELVIVNPPRRGIGEQLCELLESSEVGHVIYSSCHPESLARDLARMPSLRVREARLFDMFPQSTHSEVMVLLRRG